MLYRVGVLGGVPHFSRPKRRQAPDIRSLPVVTDIQFLSWRLCLLDEGLAQGDDAADQSLDLLAH